jgi:hypothetical protein
LRQRNRRAVVNPAVRQVAAPCKTKARREARREVRAGNPVRIVRLRSVASPREKDQTTGQAPQREQGAQGKDMEKGQRTQRDQRGKDQTTGQGQREQGQGSSQTPNQTQRDQGQIPQRQQGQQGQSQPGGQAQQGQGGGNVQSGGSVTLSTEQRTKIRETVLVGGNVPRVSNVNFSISVGTTVPETVRVVEVSPVLIEIHPEWRGHMYFVVGDEIIIVDRNHRIVAVVAV